MTRKKNTSFAWSPVRKLMKRNGATIVSRKAVDQVIFELETIAKSVTLQSLKFAHHAKRKKISKDDMALAIKYCCK